MSDPFLDALTQADPSGSMKNREGAARHLREACSLIAAVLAKCSPTVQSRLLAQLAPQVGSLLVNGNEYRSPEFIEWARQLDTEEELAASYDEVQRTGGLELHQFIDELERIAAGNE